MPAQRGKDLLLKVHDGTTFIAVAGLRTNRFALGAQAIDATHAQSVGGWRELLAGAGVKKVAVSGFGNVAWGACLKANDLGAKVVTVSGPDGYIYDADGISGEKIAYMSEMLRTNRMSVAPFAAKYKSAKFIAGKRPWEQAVDVAWTLNAPEVYDRLVRRCGWTPAAYESWLAEQLRAKLAPGCPHPRSP